MPRKKKSETPISEGSRIRHYIMDIIYHGGNYPVKLLSLRLLAKKFGVACSTVSLELDKLEHEGFITAKHGIGYFTMPQIGGNWGDSLPLVGIIMGYGKHFFYDASNWPTIANLGLELVKNKMNLRFLQIGATSEDAVLEELKNSHIDGLIWADSNEVSESLLQKLHESGIKILTVNFEYESFNSIRTAKTPLSPDSAGTAALIMHRLIKLSDSKIEHIKVP